MNFLLPIFAIPTKQPTCLALKIITFVISPRQLTHFYISPVMNVSIFPLVKLHIGLVLCGDLFESLLFIYFELLKNSVLFVRIVHFVLFDLSFLQLTHFSRFLWSGYASRAHSARWRLCCNLRLLRDRRLGR